MIKLSTEQKQNTSEIQDSYVKLGFPPYNDGFEFLVNEFPGNVDERGVYVARNTKNISREDIKLVYRLYNGGMIRMASDQEIDIFFSMDHGASIMSKVCTEKYICITYKNIGGIEVNDENRDILESFMFGPNAFDIDTGVMVV